MLTPPIPASSTLYFVSRLTGFPLHASCLTSHGFSASRFFLTHIQSRYIHTPTPFPLLILSMNSSSFQLARSNILVCIVTG